MYSAPSSELCGRHWYNYFDRGKAESRERNGRGPRVIQHGDIQSVWTDTCTLTQTRYHVYIYTYIMHTVITDTHVHSLNRYSIYNIVYILM